MIFLIKGAGSTTPFLNVTRVPEHFEKLLIVGRARTGYVKHGVNEWFMQEFDKPQYTVIVTYFFINEFVTLLPKVTTPVQAHIYVEEGPITLSQRRCNKALHLVENEYYEFLIPCSGTDMPLDVGTYCTKHIEIPRGSTFTLTPQEVKSILRIHTPHD
ncbi:hypothetical protein LX64_00328 [Chitinophaga skermanii]|uniref:Uncharacterized protein n=1 Tax=Chitinophaga skermanii TaxID=331697 RepID=A0A327R446_9BACT|nr:hypothetical protein [Chitinophaga skermanii]RAJ10722.1 hypothetical protein LX64_00328 [Chitinophaga skermanii]